MIVPMVTIGVLGAFRAEVDGRAVALGGPRQRAVLGILAAARGRAVSADRLIDDVWQGTPPAQAPASLQAYVSNLRRLLEPGRPPRAPARLLVSEAPGYALRLPPDAVDAWRFERLVADARAASPADAPALLDEALALWRGEAFAEAAEEGWARAEIVRLTELRRAARELRVAAALRLGDVAGALPDAELLTLDAPLREEGWRLYALALWRADRQGDALAALRRARTTLAEELGLDPGRPLADLEHAILTQAPDDIAPVPQQARPAAADDVLFIGREPELAALQEAAGRPGQRVVLVTGEAGLGKTSLLDRFTAGLRRDGWLVASGACLEEEGAPPAWAWSQALRAVAAEVPPPPEAAALLSDAPPPASEGGRFRLHRAVWEWLEEAARAQRLAVVLDDLHWADAETLALLSAATGAPLLLVAAYRPGEIGDRLTRTLAVLARRAPLRLALPGLAAGDVARLVAAETDGPVDGATLAALAERTGGNPFYVRESARLLAGEGGLVALSEVPEGVRDVLRRRLARLPEPAVAVLRLAALAGAECAVEPLTEAAEVGADAVLDALDAGIAAGLLAEPSPGRVRFVHALVRDTMTADLSGLRRSRMHARLAAALERLTPGDVPALAHHFARAGTAATAAKAVEYGVRAAALAGDRYAHETAVALLEQAVESYERVPEATDARRVELLGLLLRARVRAGDVAGARAARARAVEVAAGRDDLLVAAFTAWTEMTPWQSRPYGEVDTATVGLLARLLQRGDLAPADRCRLLNAYAAELSGTGDPSTLAAAEEAVEIARGLGDPTLVALTAVGLTRELPRHDGARLGRLGAEILAAGPGLPTARWSGTVNLATAAIIGGDPAAARRLVAEAGALARRAGLPDAAVVTDCAEAALAHTTGDLAGARRRYLDAATAMIGQGSMHGAGFLLLARATLAVTAGRSTAPPGLVEPDDPPELAAALRELAAGPVAADVRAAFGDGTLDGLPPLQPDFLFTVFATFRAMAAVRTGDRAAAADLHAALLPYRDGPPAGLESLSLAMRPAAHTLGDLAAVLGDDPVPYYSRALEIAELWESPHWTADARTALRRARA
ncbi:AfsR/SARP family transcriptional regulator [Actinomadura parmotrematis]|uniref:AAA family ATPase n=1 Tax=Actinomadura parmotrematis TaxID=2864039 RepID=A0ABS7G333_9ACTN|nr:AfsR/SARP family transcriptional regulator [Actinomadura parmotrematis]MBW8486961.1 AAA family ATPase [Actinomadura parmotrematis]